MKLLRHLLTAFVLLAVLAPAHTGQATTSQAATSVVGREIGRAHV